MQLNYRNVHFRTHRFGCKDTKYYSNGYNITTFLTYQNHQIPPQKKETTAETTVSITIHSLFFWSFTSLYRLFHLSSCVIFVSIRAIRVRYNHKQPRLLSFTSYTPIIIFSVSAISARTLSRFSFPSEARIFGSIHAKKSRIIAYISFT